MSTSLEPIKPAELESLGDAPSMLEVIARAASDPRVDVSKMEALLRMQERVQAKQAEMAFSQAMARLQPKLPRIEKHGRVIVSNVTRSTYAKIEDIDAMIRPLYSEEGFSISWNTRPANGPSTTVVGVLRHTGGHSEPYEITLANDVSGSKNATQGSGSTFQYGKRYLLCGMFNLITIDEDNDGNGDAITEEQVRQIQDYIAHVGLNEAGKKKFLALMNVADIADITKSNYPVAINFLRAKESR